MDVQRYPLSWPVGWKRTPAGQRQYAKFRSTSQRTSGTFTYRQSDNLTVGDALSRLAGELRRLGVRNGDWLVSSNMQTRIDGMPYANQGNPADPGVAVYFRLNKKDRVLACDAWTRAADNIAAVAAHIDCLRGIDRYKVGSLDQAFAGYAALPAKGATWRTTLGFPPDAVVTVADVELAFRARARTAHPDVEGGSHDAMTSLTAAKTEALAELRT